MTKRYPFLDKVNLVNADEEYNYTFPVGTKAFTIQTRSGVKFKYAWKPGDILLDKYISANQGITKLEENMGLSETLTIYFSCSDAGEIMEVEYFL